jgi:hypothetical protein
LAALREGREIIKLESRIRKLNNSKKEKWFNDFKTRAISKDNKDTISQKISETEYALKKVYGNRR